MRAERLGLLCLLSAGVCLGLRGDLTAVLHKLQWDSEADDTCYDFVADISPAEDSVCGGCGPVEICHAPVSIDSDIDADANADEADKGCRSLPSVCQVYASATMDPAVRPPRTTPRQPTAGPAEATTRRTATPPTRTPATAPPPAEQTRPSTVPAELADACNARGLEAAKTAIIAWRPWAKAARYERYSYRAYFGIRFGQGVRAECSSDQQTKSVRYYAYLPETKRCAYVGRFGLCPADKAAFAFLHDGYAACNSRCLSGKPPTTATGTRRQRCTIKSSRCKATFRAFPNPRFRGEACGERAFLYSFAPKYGRCARRRYYGCNPFSQQKSPVTDAQKKRYRATNQFETLAECNEICCK